MTNQTKLDLLFSSVQQGAAEFATRNPEGDGRAFWQPIKQLFGKQDIRASGWQRLNSGLVAKLMNLSEFDESGNIILLNHYLRQQVRIPTEEEPILRKIMQLALNSGYFIASKDKQELDRSLKDFDYGNSGLERLTTYISKDEIVQISSQISPGLVEEVETYFKRSLCSTLLL